MAITAVCRLSAYKAIADFAEEYGAKYPKALDSLTRDHDKLLTFFDFPAEHWKHLRTSNPIESTFATVRLRQRVTKGPGSRTRGLTMAFKLIQMAQDRWRRECSDSCVSGHDVDSAGEEESTWQMRSE